MFIIFINIFLFIRPLRLKPTSVAKTISDSNEQLSSPLLPSPPPPPVIAPEYTNGHYSSSNNSVDEPQTTPVQNGLSDNHIEDEIDNDDGQWSDWEHNPEPTDTFDNYPETFPSSPPPPPIEEPIISKPVSSPIKSLKLNNISKPKWDPNAPLGSEYEINPVVLARKKSTQVETLTNQDTDDFFKDMTPKVQTVQLMQQLETMFNVTTDQSNQQSKLTTTTVTSSFFNKFGIMSQDHDDNQEIENENNNWDE